MSSELNHYLQKHPNASCNVTEGAEGGFFCTITCHDGRQVKCGGSSKKKAKELAIEEWRDLPAVKPVVKPVKPDDDEKVAQPPTINLDEVPDDSDNVTSSERTSDGDDEIYERLETLEEMSKDQLAKIDALTIKVDALPDALRHMKSDLMDDLRRQQNNFIDELRRACPRGGAGGNA